MEFRTPDKRSLSNPTPREIVEGGYRSEYNLVCFSKMLVFFIVILFSADCAGLPAVHRGPGVG